MTCLLFLHTGSEETLKKKNNVEDAAILLVGEIRLQHLVNDSAVDFLPAAFFSRKFHPYSQSSFMAVLSNTRPDKN